MEFEKVTKEHILEAIKDFEERGIPKGFGPSSTYDLVFNGKEYPPKAVMAYANYRAIGKEIAPYFKGGTGTDAFKSFENNGFEIVPKDGDKLEKIIAEYKLRIQETRLENEIYKWELLNTYRGRPNLNTEDLFKEVKDVKFKNLVYAMGIAVFNKLTELYPSEMKDLLSDLFNHEKDLEVRIKNYSEESLKLYRLDEKKLGHHQDERSIASYLAFQDANKYPLYKDSFYKKFCKLNGVTNKPKGQKYVHYKSMLENFIDEYIKPDQELIDLVRSYLPENAHEDSNHYILAQDVLYQMLDQEPEEAKDWNFEMYKEFKYFEKYITNLRFLLEQLGLKKGDPRVVFSITRDRLTFTIGQRYCFTLYTKDKRGLLGVISTLPITEQVSDYAGKPEAYLNFFNEIEINESQWVSIIKACKSELSRTTKSGYSKFNNTDFEEFLFNNIKTSQVNKKQAKNMILYGPPGTGKTYNTINSAVKIANPDFDLTQNRNLITNEFDRLCKDGRISFTTFHQSMSYEDFIEGIKADTAENGEINYSIKPGIFKKIVKRAFKNQIVGENFENTYKKLLENIKQNNGSLILETTERSKEFTIYENSKGNLKFHSNSGKQYPAVMKKDFIQTYLETDECLDWPSYIKGVGKYMVEELGYSLKTKKDESNYVLIIDEINRGNVSAIFGELITLLEDDKRAGAENELNVKLTYSQEEFSIPNNVYIIGTMNTADRSVEALDTALRRRFSFVEMIPEPKKIESDGASKGKIDDINLVKLLSTINERIEILVDRDHTIGHAFFMNARSLSDLKAVIADKIIPLLQEYFYGDYHKMELVLGNGFFKKKSVEKVAFAVETDLQFEGEMFTILDAKKMSDKDFKDAITGIGFNAE